MKVMARNRKAFHDYEIIEKFEAGIELFGSEVKSIRAGRINLLDSYAACRGGELTLHHMHISPFEQANQFNHDPYRNRRLLMHKREIIRLDGEVNRKRLSIIPLSVYFDKQWIKLELGLCKGRKKYDKRGKISDKENRKKLRGLVKGAARSLALILFAFSCATAGIKHRDISSGKTDTLPSVVLETGRYVSIPHLCGCMGFDWSWDEISGKLACRGRGVEIVFTQDMHFFSVAGSLYRLALAPRRAEGSLYVALSVINDGLAGSASLPLVYDALAGLLITGGQAPETDIHPAPVAPPLETKPLPAPVRGEPVRVIVIDPGHGGKDPGALGSGGTREKDVVLPIGLFLRDILNKNGDFTIYMTRDKDVFVPLRERTEFANRKKADIFISLHANSIMGNAARKKQIRGYKMYFLSHAKNEEDKLAAMIENSVIELEGDAAKGDYLQNILIDMANNEYQKESEELSIMIAESFGKNLSNIQNLHKGVGQAPFWVLNGAFMPSVLVEAAFISNPQEEKLLTSEKFQKNVAGAIAEAVIKFKEKYEAGL